MCPLPEIRDRARSRSGPPAPSRLLLSAHGESAGGPCAGCCFGPRAAAGKRLTETAPFARQEHSADPRARAPLVARSGCQWRSPAEGSVQAKAVRAALTIVDNG
jgi:hypothetical protein